MLLYIYSIYTRRIWVEEKRVYGEFDKNYHKKVNVICIKLKKKKIKIIHINYTKYYNILDSCSTVIVNQRDVMSYKFANILN